MVLVVGASGMLGSAMLRFFLDSPQYRVFGAARSSDFLRYLPARLHESVVTGFDCSKPEELRRVMRQVQPDVVVNCIGVVKQSHCANDPLIAIPINSYFPHLLAQMCQEFEARLVHFSTDCVFSGSKGLYREDDQPDSRDLYGLTKLLGEVDYSHDVTLRTSVIGHELNTSKSLVSWFLSQDGVVNGFTNAVFSGLPAVELAKIVHDFVIPNRALRGVYHVSADPISKFDLLTLVSRAYGKAISIIPVELPAIDRSLDSIKFRASTGYSPPSWPDLIQSMHQFR